MSKFPWRTLNIAHKQAIDRGDVVAARWLASVAASEAERYSVERVALDGAQPERCHAGGDGDCEWAECPQKANYQRWCPLAAIDGAQP